MKIFGIICEYDPLHLGHLRHINFTKNLIGNDGIILCVMSGNFTQRGLPATLDKFSRAKHAILSGADAVIELPTLFSTASASDFAWGAVQILNKLKADGLSCGIENGDKNQIIKMGNFLVKPDKIFDETVKYFLSKGENYPTAVSLAEKKILGSDLLNTPNNLLAIEYAKAIKSINSNMILETLKRDSDFHQEDNPDNCSSSTIRKAFAQHRLDKVKKHLPEYVFEDLSISFANYQKRYQNFLPIFLATKTKDNLAQIDNVTEGLNNFIYENLNGNYDDFIKKIKTKRYTRAKLNRILLYSVLDITKKENTLKESLNIPINFLAIKKESNVLKILKERSKIDLCNNRMPKTQEEIEINKITQKADRFYATMYNIVYDKNTINKLKKY